MQSVNYRCPFKAELDAPHALVGCGKGVDSLRGGAAHLGSQWVQFKGIEPSAAFPSLLSSDSEMNGLL